jgi:hypothetical protein
MSVHSARVNGGWDMGNILPVWSGVLPRVAESDPIVCPVQIEDMAAYLRPLLSFEFRSSRLELIRKGRIAERLFWLWAFYGDDGHRWNLIVFSEASNAPTLRTLMCADSNPHGLNDDEYVVAIHNEEY